MAISDNIKKLRAAEKLTQQEFADRIGVKRNTVATYEMGRSEPSEAAIMLICREFDVQREWLVSGVGEMYVKRDDTTALIDKLSDEYHLDAKSREFLKNFVRLSPEMRRLILDGMEQAARLFPRTKSDDELTPDEKAEIVRRESLEEAEAKKTAATMSSASTGTSGTSKKISVGN